MRAVNLLPRDEQPRSFEARRGVVFAGAGGTALVTVAFAMLLIAAGGTISQNQQTRDQLRVELASVPKPAIEHPDVQIDAALAAEKSRRVSALSAALGGRIAWDRVLRQISQVLPEDVWLTTLSTSGSDAAPAAGAPAVVPGIVLNGSTYSQDGVARFLARIAVLPTLSNVRLQTSASDPAGASKVVLFTVLADVKTPGAGS